MARLITSSKLLRSLDPEDLACFEPHLARKHLVLGQVLCEPGEEIREIVFPEGRIGSITAVSGSLQMEVAQCGAESMTGGEVLNGVFQASHRVLVQQNAEALCIDRETFLDLVHGSSPVQKLFAAYQEAFIIEVTHAALVAGRYPIEQRLARWILMAHDRVEGDEVDITHETLSQMIGVRRAGITTALHILEGKQMIRSSRGKITMRDRAMLEKVAGESYGLPEEAYRRLVVRPFQRSTHSGLHRTVQHHAALT